jgi:Aspartyl protease/gag-polyprotein putative aspartyl protease
MHADGLKRALRAGADAPLAATRVLAGAALLLSAACAHLPPPSLHTARLVVRRNSGAVAAFIRARVGGETLSLLVDTGANTSVLPAQFARAHHLEGATHVADRQVHDAHGRTVEAGALRDVPVEFEGEPAGGGLDFITSEEMGLEGILAPQDLLQPGAALVIDLGREELRLEREEDALARVSAASPGLRELDFRRCPMAHGNQSNDRIVSVTINGVETRMLIDTGASRTVLARNNPALKSMLEATGERRTTRALASVGQGLVVDDVPVTFADSAFVMPVTVNPASQACGDGLLGADLLSNCTLVWGWRHLWVACRAPAQRSPP